MAGRKKRPPLAEELRVLDPVVADPRAAAAQEILRGALGSPRSFVVARAATLIQEHRLEGFERELRAAFERFLQDPVKSDPGCRAKTAAIEALDYTESFAVAPFVAAARHVQME